MQNDTEMAFLEANLFSPEIGAKRAAMVEYARKLTVEPAKMTKVDVDRLREVGFSDRDILEIAEVASYFAFVNRLADGLGVQLESWFSED